MRTVQSYLRETDRERLLDALAYDLICDTLLLLELKDKTVGDIQDACRKHMNSFIDHLISMKAEPSDHMVLYMCGVTPLGSRYNREDKTLFLIDLNEVRKDIHASSYGFLLTDWGETLGYLVAETKLTQDYMPELLSQYLQEISFFGTEPEEHRKKTEEVHADLKQSMKDIREGRTKSAEKFFDDLAREHGWPIDEKDEFQDSLKSEIIKAEMKYSRYCHWHERSRILVSLGESAPVFEE